MRLGKARDCRCCAWCCFLLWKSSRSKGLAPANALTSDLTTVNAQTLKGESPEPHLTLVQGFHIPRNLTNQEELSELYQIQRKNTPANHGITGLNRPSLHLPALRCHLAH